MFFERTNALYEVAQTLTSVCNITYFTLVHSIYFALCVNGLVHVSEPNQR